MTQKKELVVHEPKQMAMVNMAMDDDDGITSADIQVPRLALLQGLSPAVNEGKGKMGEFMDSLTGEKLASPVELAVIKKKNGAIYFVEGEGMKCKSDDGVSSFRGDRCVKCPFGVYWAEWKDDKPPKCAQTLNFFSVTKDTLNGNDVRPLIVSFSKMSLKVGRKLSNILAMNKMKGHIYSSTILLSSEIMKDGNRTYALPIVQKGSALSPAEMQAANEWASLIKQKQIIEVDDSMSANSEVDELDDIDI